MACGVPVLVSDVARLVGTVDHDENGLVVPAGEVDAWTSAISRLASDPNRRERWGANGRTAAVERFSWPKIADQFEAVVSAEVEAYAEEKARAEEEARAKEEERAQDAEAEAGGDDPVAAPEI